jgi:hypothetical protein
MKVCYRRWSLAVLLAAGLAGLAVGCGDLGSMAYFLTPEQRLPAKMKHLANEDKKKKTPRVIILTYARLDTRAEFIHADRQISELLAGNLRQLAEPKQEQIDIVPPRKVEEFKNTHPSWREMEVAEIGRKFGADYVIYLEINSLSMYEPGNNNTLYRGRANLLVSLVDVNRPDDPLPQQNYVCTFPSEARGPVPVTDIEMVQFRQSFLSYVARQLSWYFSKYPREEQRVIAMEM